MMRIAIDITQVIYETGVSVYTRELTRGLVELFSGNEYVLVGGSLRRGREIHKFAGRFTNARSIVTPISPTVADVLWNRLHVLPIETIVGKVDLFHSSDWAEPPSRCPKVTTIHDLSFMHYPQYIHPRIYATHMRRLKWVVKESAGVIVPSKTTEEDAVKLGITQDKIFVIPEAPSSNYKKQNRQKVEAVKRKYGIVGEYALTVGASPRKNIARIINAFAKAKNDAKLEELVVVGRGDSFKQKGVVFLGHVPTSDLPALYSGASLFVYASLYEGFGLPILEAMSCGCPVVTSNVSSMPEVAGDAAVLVNPESIDDISEGILTGAKNSKRLIIKGKARAREFSWDRTVKETMKVYKQVV